MNEIINERHRKVVRIFLAIWQINQTYTLVNIVTKLYKTHLTNGDMHIEDLC